MVRFDQADQLQMLQMRGSVIVTLQMSFCDCDAPDERFWMTNNVHAIPQMEISLSFNNACHMKGSSTGC